MKKYDHLTPGLTFWVVGFLALSIWVISAVDKTATPKPTTQKVVQEYHFHKPQGNVTVVTPSQVKLAGKFGHRVYGYAKQISSVNNDTVFPSNRLLMAIAATESSFSKDAESSSSVGLLQINYRANGLDRKSLFDVKTNVKQSVKILVSLHRVCKGNLKCTLLSYNVGHRAYIQKKYNIAYYNKVMSYYN
jgi:hypothetical protein